MRFPSITSTDDMSFVKGWEFLEQATLTSFLQSWATFSELILKILKGNCNLSNFYVWLTVHPNRMIIFFYQLDAQILYFNTFIMFPYMFRALLCSSSGGQIVLVQHLVSSLSLGDCSDHMLREDSVGGRPVHGTATYRVWWYHAV